MLWLLNHRYLLEKGGNWMLKIIKIECEGFDDCDYKTPCDFVKKIYENIGHGDEILCTNGIMVWIDWTEQSPKRDASVVQSEEQSL